MEKSNKIYMIVIFVCAALVIGLCGYAIITHKDEKISDAMKFKNEYEALNELVNEGLQTKLAKMPVEAQMKLQETLERIVNEGSGGLICIIS